VTQQGPNGTELQQVPGPLLRLLGRLRPREHGQNTDSSFLAAMALRDVARRAHLIRNRVRGKNGAKSRRFSGAVREVSVSVAARA